MLPEDDLDLDLEWPALLGGGEPLEDLDADGLLLLLLLRLRLWLMLRLAEGRLSVRGDGRYLGASVGERLWIGLRL